MSSRLFRIVRASRQGILYLSKSFHTQRTFSKQLLHNKQLPSTTKYSYCQIRGLCASATKFEKINIQDTEDFKKRVLESSIPVVVDFHASWCGPCKLLGPRLESVLSEKEGKVTLAKVDVDENVDLAMNYGINSVPTVMAVKNGKILDKFVGLKEDDKINSFVENLIN